MRLALAYQTAAPSVQVVFLRASGGEFFSPPEFSGSFDVSLL